MLLEMLRCVAPHSIAVLHRGYVPPVTKVVQEVSNQILVLFAKPQSTGGLGCFLGAGTRKVPSELG
jgi:hypothetical protein